MKAGEVAIGEILKASETYYRIPYYQRRYVWDQDNWKQLWDELCSPPEECFLGAIIVKTIDDAIKQVHYRDVIDGQQRLTTFMLLTRAIIDEFLGGSESLEKIEDEGLRDILCCKKEDYDNEGNTSRKYFIRLEQSRINKVDFDAVIKGEYQNLGVDKYEEYKSKNNIIAGYLFFKKEIKEKRDNGEVQTIIGVINRLKNTIAKTAVLIDVKANENEQLIFDTINTAGVKLTCADIVKNYLFRRVKELYKDERKTDTLYDDNWAEVFEVNPEIADEWYSTTVIGKSSERARIELFLQSFGIIKGIFNPNDKEHNLEKLAKLYSDYIANINTISQIEAFVKELCDAGKIYKKYFIDLVDEIKSHGLVFYDKNESKDDNAIMHVLQIVSYLNTTTCDSYILKTILDKDNVADKLNELEYYLIRNYIYEQRTDKNFNKEIANVVRGELVKGEDTKYSISYLIKRNDLSDTRIRESINDIENDSAKLILYWVELYRNYVVGGDLTAKYPLDKKAIQLEHIMPQSWKENWAIDYRAQIENFDSLTEEDKEKAIETLDKNRDATVRRLGNMTLLRAKKNDELSNASFIKKIEGFDSANGKKKIDGYKKCCCAMITTQDVLGKTEWNEQEINYRTDNLFKYICEIWKLN